MVSPNHRLVAEANSGQNETNGHQSSGGDSMAVEDDGDRQQVVVNCLQLHRYLHSMCSVDPSDGHLWLGCAGDRLDMGCVQLSTQRRSVTRELDVVANGLRPLKGSANRFAVNEISDVFDTAFNGSKQYNDSVIEFCEREGLTGLYPMSEECNVVAVSRGGQLFVKDDQRLVAIRPKDGFVLIHSCLMIIDGQREMSSESFDGQSSGDHSIHNQFFSYSSEQKGHLFVVGSGAHLLVVDKHRRKECVLFVGVDGLDVYSLSSSSQSSHKCIDFVDRPIVLRHSSRTSQMTAINGQQIDCISLNDSKRQTNETNGKSKRHKHNHWPNGNHFVGQSS